MRSTSRPSAQTTASVASTGAGPSASTRRRREPVTSTREIDWISAGAASGHVVAVALPIDWKDVGGFASLAEVLAADADGNVTEGLVVANDAADNLVINTVAGHAVAVSGVTGMVVVHTPDATLVTTLAGAESVKAVVAAVAGVAPDLT